MLQSNIPYWIASRDYYFVNDNTTSGQTAIFGAIRLMIELDLTMVKLNRNGNITSLS